VEKQFRAKYDYSQVGQRSETSKLIIVNILYFL